MGTGTITLTSKAEEFHILGQHDQLTHAPGGGGGINAAKVAGAIGAVAIGVGLAYYAKSRGGAQLGKKVAGTVDDDVTGLAGKGVKFSDLKVRRKVYAINDTSDINGVPTKKAYEVRLDDGTSIKLHDLDGSLPRKQVNETLNAAAAAHEMYPMKSPVRIVVMNDDIVERMLKDKARSDKLKGVDGFVMAGVKDKNDIYISAPIAVKPADAAMFETSMPVAGSMSRVEYTVMHEYGHRYDVATGFKSGGKLGTPHDASLDEMRVEGHFDVFDSLSPYGKQNEMEGYAESFVEWHGTGGTTTNLAAQTYAKAEGWIQNG